jgi:transposase
VVGTGERSERIVCRFLATLRVRRPSQLTVRFETPPGEQAQADWAEAGRYHLLHVLLAAKANGDLHAFGDEQRRASASSASARFTPNGRSVRSTDLADRRAELVVGHRRRRGSSAPRSRSR